MAEFKGGAGDGNRIRQLERERERAQDEYRTSVDSLQQETERAAVVPLAARFAATSTVVDEEFTRRTTGLVTAEQFRTKRRELVDELSAAAELARQQSREAEERQRKKQKTAHTAALSFVDDEEEDSAATVAVETSASPTGRLVMKNPRVETSFLPDRERELRDAETRERLAREWVEEQQRIKASPIEITYSYWDGSGHRRTMKTTKGTTVAQFLDRARGEFRELRAASVDQLMFVKEDLIIPHTFSFYDLIESKARGKSGPLFHFDVHDDVRLVADSTVEKDESHAAKIVERHWYEHNKHLFPVNRWEVYDPQVQRGDYTISDRSSKLPKT